MNRFLSAAMGVVMLVMIAPTFLLTGCTTSSSPRSTANNDTFFIGAPTHGAIGWVNKNGTMAERNNGTAAITTPNGKTIIGYTDTTLITQEAGTPTKTCTLGENAMGNTRIYSCTASYILNGGISGGAPPIRKVNIYTANATNTANTRAYFRDTTPALARKTLTEL